MGEWVERKLDPSAAKLMDVRGDLNPAMWAHAIREQQGRVAAASAALSQQVQRGGKAMLDKEPFRRVRFESHFLLVAIGNVIRLRRVFFDLTNDPRLAEAQREFDAAAPDAKDLRDMLEHMDSYALGTGHLQTAGKVDKRPDFQIVTLLNNTDRVRLRFDTHEVDLEAAARAALELAEAAEEVSVAYVDRALAEWTGPHAQN